MASSGDELKNEKKSEKKNERKKNDFENFEGAVVTPEWLSENLEKVKVLDASWYMPAENRKPKEEFQAGRICGANFFDIDAISDPNSDLPHMLPSEAAFSVSLSSLSLSNSDPIVVYDKKGIFSAARAWWMFRAFGHKKIWVLQGGFPKYNSLNLPVNSGSAEKELKKAAEAVEAVKTFQKAKISEVPAGSYKAHLQHDLVWSLDQVLETLESKSHQIVDARSSGRFKGVDPEPRKGVRGGHIPGSVNVPFPQVLTPDGFLRDVTELKETFETAGLQLDQPIVASCGTGVTACVLALAFFQLGKKDVPVYDGSWSEWGGREDTPVFTATETSKISV